MGEFGEPCECAKVGDFSVIRMGGDGSDERVFASLCRQADYGEDKWWLFASRCVVCGQNWMVAQEQRVHDNYYLKRISVGEIKAIVELGDWPSDFLRFEDVIRLGPDNGQTAHFFDANDLTSTVKELIEERTDMTAGEIAYLLALSVHEAERLMERANSMTWAQLRPFAQAT